MISITYFPPFIHKIFWQRILARLLCPILAGLLWITAMPSAQAISGGEFAQEGEFPWFVAIGPSNKLIKYGWPFCGGALIKADWVLTAAHCLTAKNITSPNRLKVMIDAVDLNKLTSTMKAGVVEKIILNQDDVDLALLKVNFHTNITDLKTIPWARGKIPILNQTIISIGFGSQIDPKAPASRLNKLESPVVGDNDRRCRRSSSKGLYPLKPFMFCAGYRKTNKQTHMGDSGGPAVEWNTDSINTPYTLVGIIEDAYNELGYMNDSFFSGYLDVGQFAAWIEQTIATN